MLNRPVLLAVALASGLTLFGCSSSSSGGSSPNSSPTGKATATSTIGRSHSPSPSASGGSGSASPGTSASPPSNPAIASVDKHLDLEGQIISKLGSTKASHQSALVSKAFVQLSDAVHVLQGGIHGVPSSLTQKFVADLRAALAQEPNDKRCVATHSETLCKSVAKTSTKQFKAIAADRKKLDTYDH